MIDAMRRCGALGLLVAAAARAADSGPAFTWEEPVVVAVGRGERGPWRQNESRYDYVDDPTVARDDRGRITVAWVDQARKDVLLRRFSATTGRPLGAAVNVSRSPQTFSWLPRLALAPDAPEEIFVLWQEIIFSGGSHGGDILFARSGNGGADFSRPLNLSDSMGGDGKGRISRAVWHNGSLDLIAGSGGALHAAWTEFDGPLWFARSGDGGASFSRPRLVAGGRGGEPARAPALALAPDGSVYLAWTTGESDAADVRVARSADGGASFGEPRIVARSRGYSDAPKLVADPDGVLHVVFGESAGGPFARSQIWYARSADGGQSFDAPRAISPATPGTDSGAAFPALSADAHGNLHVLWELVPGPRERPRGLGLVVSYDRGRSFTAPMVVPGSIDPAGGSNGSHQGLLMRKLAVDAEGAVAIVNSSLRTGAGSRVWLIRAAPARASD